MLKKQCVQRESNRVRLWVVVWWSNPSTALCGIQTLSLGEEAETDGII